MLGSPPGPGQGAPGTLGSETTTRAPLSCVAFVAFLPPLRGAGIGEAPEPAARCPPPSPPPTHQGLLCPGTVGRRRLPHVEKQGPCTSSCVWAGGSPGRAEGVRGAPAPKGEAGAAHVRGRSGTFASQLERVWGWISLPAPPLSLRGAEPREGRESMQGHTAGPGMVTGPGAGRGALGAHQALGGGKQVKPLCERLPHPLPLPSGHILGKTDLLTPWHFQRVVP